MHMNTKSSPSARDAHKSHALRSQDVASLFPVRAAVHHLRPPAALRSLTWHDQLHQHGQDHVDSESFTVFYCVLLWCLTVSVHLRLHWCTCSPLSLPLSYSSLFRFFTGGSELPGREVRTSEVSLWDDAEGPTTAWYVSDNNHIRYTVYYKIFCSVWGLRDSNNSRSSSKLVLNKI